MKQYNTMQLANGLRIVHFASEAKVVYCGIAVAAGTRHEQPGQEGLAHLCEHLAFKGTARRQAVRIINDIEGVGGELNAFTNKEDTVYYCAVDRSHFRRAVDVLTDIVFNSSHPLHEVEKEREVVCDEIESYEDSPSELIYDEFENIIFRGHPLGHNILGTAEHVRSYGPLQAQAFTREHYHPANCVFFVSGDIDFRRLTRQLEQASFGSHDAATSPPASTPQLPPLTIPAPTIRIDRGTHQAHVMIGTRAFAANDSRRWALYLLNNILGGPSMNSRLNLALRERNALVYTVDSSMVCYNDTGLWAVYFGCDPADVERCRRLVARQLQRLCEKPLAATTLAAAKRQLKGQLAIACDNREQFALELAKDYLHTGKLRQLEQLVSHVDRLSAADLHNVACQLFQPDKLTTLIYQ